MNKENSALKETSFNNNIYWLYLEPYTFVFEGENTGFIIYNSYR